MPFDGTAWRPEPPPRPPVAVWAAIALGVGFLVALVRM